MLRILLIAVAFAFSSSLYSQKATHEEATQYYKYLMKQTIDISLKITKLGNLLAEYSEIAGKCQYMILDKERYDTINNLFSETSSILNKGIFGIIGLKEVDPGISIKYMVLQYLGGLNKCLGDAFPVFLSTFQNGIKDYTKEKISGIRSTYDNYFGQLQIINKQVDSLEIVSNKFLAKYNLSEYEMLKEGL